jgi:hypothetical protein
MNYTFIYRKELEALYTRARRLTKEKEIELFHRRKNKMERKVLFNFLDSCNDIEQEIIADKINDIDTCIEKLNEGKDLTPYQFSIVSDILHSEKRRVENSGDSFVGDIALENFYTDIYNGLFEETWLGKPIKISGTLGFWNGRKEIEPKYYKDLEETFNKLLTGYDNFVLEQEGDKYILSLIHHDSRHILELESVEEIPQEEEE